jgi:hypothetical protein
MWVLKGMFASTFQVLQATQQWPVRGYTVHSTQKGQWLCLDIVNTLNSLYTNARGIDRIVIILQIYSSLAAEVFRSNKQVTKRDKQKSDHSTHAH